jgi:hypothetical protein
MLWDLLVAVTCCATLVTSGCGGGDEETDGDADGDADADADVESDEDGDVDVDGDMDGDADSDRDDVSDAEGDADTDIDGPSTPSAYGVFQLYGDEYQDFRRAMGFSLPDYWAFVDEHVARLGVRFTRTNTLLIWGLVEPELGAGYIWDTPMQTDAVIRAVYAPAPGKEMDILLVIEPRRGARDAPPYPDGLEAEYQDYVRAVVERYDGDGTDDVGGGVRVRHWQVMNEPFFDLDAGRMTAEEYADLVRLTEAAVHDADPDARVALGDTGRHQRDIIPLLDGVPFDAVDVHYWSTADDYLLPVLEPMRRGLDGMGLVHVEIWMCEFGTYTNEPDRLPPHTDEYQARWLVKAMVANRAGGVRRILWNNLVGWTNFGGDPGSMFNFMGLISSGAASGDRADDLGRERPAYAAFQRLVAETDTDVADLGGPVDGLPGSARAVSFTPRDGGPTFFVAWSDADPATVDLPCPRTAARVSSLVPDEVGLFDETVVPTEGGVVSVELGEDPVLVRPEG